MTQANNVAIESSQINSSGVLLTTGGGTGLATVGTNGQVLTSNGTTLSWVTPSAGTSFSGGTTGFTPNTATTGTVTLGGTLVIANGGTGLTSFTAGQIHYGSFSQSANLFWDSTNNRLGVNTSSPTAPLDVRGNGYFINSSSPTSFWSVDSGLTTGSGYCQWNTSVNSFISGSYTSHPYYFVTGNTERMRITVNGGVAFNGASNYGSSGQVLTSAGDAPPTWGAVSSLSGSAFSASTNGYYKVATSGMIIQWGVTGTIATSGTASVTFPITFPNACFMAMNSMQVSSTANSYYASHTTPSTTGMTINSNGAIVAAQAWIAIGY
jgi:hypothetical protein